MDVDAVASHPPKVSLDQGLVQKLSHRMSWGSSTNGIGIQSGQQPNSRLLFQPTFLAHAQLALLPEIIQLPQCGHDGILLAGKI